MGDEHRPVEHTHDRRGDGRERGGLLERRGVEPVHVRRAAEALGRSHEGRDLVPLLVPDPPLDADLDDAIVHGIEARHLQVHEGERGFPDR